MRIEQREDSAEAIEVPEQTLDLVAAFVHLTVVHPRSEPLGAGVGALMLLTPWRRRHRSSPERETSLQRNSHVIASRSSSGINNRRLHHHLSWA